MSINILKEFLIHFHTFRNIDLINQGLYQVRTKVYYIEKGVKYFALPYFYIESKESESNSQTDEHNIKPHSIISNHIADNNSEYVTKTFLVRYSDEEVEIDEFCYFRIEVPYSKLATGIMYHIEFDLFFSDTFTSVNKDKRGGQNVLSNVEFRGVCTQVLIVNLTNELFLEQYAPIVYNDSYSSILNVSIHTILLDYKLRINNLKPFLIEGVQNKSVLNNNNGSTNNNTNNNNLNNMLVKNNSIDHFNTKSVNSLIQFFLEDKNLYYNLDPDVIDQLYEKYVVSLIHQFLALKSKYTRLIGKLLDEKMKSEFPFFVVKFEVILANTTSKPLLRRER